MVMQQQQEEKVQKSAIHVQSCYFANLNLLLFYCSRCHRFSRCLGSLMVFLFGAGHNMLLDHSWSISFLKFPSFESP